MKRRVSAALLAALFVVGCKPESEKASPDAGSREKPAVAHEEGGTEPPGAGDVSGKPLQNIPPDASRPRFSPDGRRVAFQAGAAGKRDVYVADLEGTNVQRLTTSEADDIEPAWDPSGERIVFASNLDGDYDLYVVRLKDGEVEKVSNMPGDEREPAVSPLRYNFWAVTPDHCSPDGTSGEMVDNYDKVFFTRRYEQGKREEVWFVSMALPRSEKVKVKKEWKDIKFSPHGSHLGRISAEGGRCREPSWSGDGLSLTWVCEEGQGPVILDGAAHWEQSFKDALDAVGAGKKGAKSCDYDDDACQKSLPHRYSTYAGSPASKPGDGVTHPAVSANQIVLIGSGKEEIVRRGRKLDGAWKPFHVKGTAPANAAWSPDGTLIAYDAGLEGKRTIFLADVHFYLQDVTNLDDFPELYAEESALLAKNRFVARPGKEKEFYVLYEKLNYDRRPIFITADVALQVFNDEFQFILQRAEQQAAKNLEELSRVLMEHYVDRWKESGSDVDRYYAAYFATAWVPLAAAAGLETPSFDDYTNYESMTKAEKKRVEKLTGPVSERLSKALPGILAKLPPELLQEVRDRLDAMFSHEGEGVLAVPSRKEPVIVDWTQFELRGYYAEDELAGYFLAMNWYAAAPLPFDASLAGFLDVMETKKVGELTGYEIWTEIDAMVGAFMGRPVDPTLDHLRTVRKEMPEAFKAFDAGKLAGRLEKLRGPMPLRDLEAGLKGEAKRELQVTLFPKRLGLDATFFSGLTHPAVKGRTMPSALDVMAALGVPAARKHALAAQPEEWARQYRKVLDELAGEAEKGKGLAATDIYHSWLAVLGALARSHEVPVDSLLEFARTEAWHDLKLYSALAGYTQLKHGAVLYNMMDLGLECDSEAEIYVLVEAPVLPMPEGFVDPQPEFFEALAKLAKRVYGELYVGKDEGEPLVLYGRDVDKFMDARLFALNLADIARRELSGKPLKQRDYEWILWTGERVELLMKRSTEYDPGLGNERRKEHGVALVADIHASLHDGKVLEVGVGRIMDLYVVVPGEVGRKMTQGGIFSFYEFQKPMQNRLTDEQWNKLLEAGKAPDLPAWTKSFIDTVQGSR